MKSSILATVAAAGMVGRAVADLPSIVTKGSKFFYPNGTQFFIRGVAYQQDYLGNGTTSSGGNYTDPLSNGASCKRDIPYLTELLTNTIRVYAIDPTADHDDCMSQLQDAGIYVFADLSAPGASIETNDPAWNNDLFDRYTSVIDTMQKYSNVIGFFAGNEVTNQTNNTDAAPFVKAAVRDTKAYIRSKNYRDSLGIGYATDDDSTIRVPLIDYFNCGNQSDAVDFWGYNIYSWCGDSSYAQSGYEARTQLFSNYSVPAFFAEYGCNTVQPRPFTEVQALFGPQMTPVWSGGIVYMYFQESNDYGLVTVNGNSVTTNQDFNNLKTQMSSVTPTGVVSASYTPSNSPQACPTINSNDWEAASSPLPPTPSDAVCNCMYQSLSCIVSPGTSSDDYGNLFSEVFGYMANNGGIPGITTNGTTGQYGEYSMCNATEQLGYAFNLYASAQSSMGNPTACSFGGSATSQAASTATSCGGILSTANAGVAGTPVASSSSHKGAAAGLGASTVFRPSDSSPLPLIALTALAAMSGFGMVFL